jgi:hypothetical protein
MCPLLFLDTSKHTRDKPIEKEENDCEKTSVGEEISKTDDNKDFEN